MIRFSNGQVFEYMAAAGALSYDGQGWLWDRLLQEARVLDTAQFLSVTPSLTLHERKGNLSWLAPWQCVRPLFDGHHIVGFVNAKGLSNPGLSWWLRNVEPLLERPVVVSIYSQNIDEIRTMAVMLKSDKIAAIELNASCPNTGEVFYENSVNVMGAVMRLKETTALPVIVKVSVAQDLLFLSEALHGIADAISINAVPWKMVFPSERSPLHHLGGGAVSGKAAQELNWNAVCQLKLKGTIPVIGPSVWRYEDIAALRRIGADAVSFGSVFLRFPHRVTGWVRKDRKERFNGHRLS